MSRFVFSILFSAAMIGLMGCVSAEKGARLRVMTYNVHHAEGTDGKIDLERIAKLITDNKVDLVALQEVDRNTERTGHLDMPAELARLTGMKAAFGANIPLEGGEYGNAILSRFPFEVVTNHHLPKIVEGEQRGMLETAVKSPLGKITFCVTHLDHRRPEADRLASVDYMQRALEKKSPLILAGDFNARPVSETYRRLKAVLQDAWEQGGHGEGFTIPSEAPKSRIDYFWCRGLKANAATVLASNASDHLPLLVDMEVSR